MGSVESIVSCPLCRGEMREDFNYRTDSASYFCGDCGYASNTDIAAASPNQLEEIVGKELLPFVKVGTFGDDDGAVICGTMPFYPSGLEMMGLFEIHPVVIRKQLRWLRSEIEEIPELESKNYPRENGDGFYKYRKSTICAHYESFNEALEATRETNLAAQLDQSELSKDLGVKLLSEPEEAE